MVVARVRLAPPALAYRCFAAFFWKMVFCSYGNFNNVVSRFYRGWFRSNCWENLPYVSTMAAGVWVLRVYFNPVVVSSSSFWKPSMRAACKLRAISRITFQIVNGIKPLWVMPTPAETMGMMYFLPEAALTCIGLVLMPPTASLPLLPAIGVLPIYQVAGRLAQKKFETALSKRGNSLRVWFKYYAVFRVRLATTTAVLVW